MRFMMMVKGDSNCSVPTPELTAAIGRLSEEMMRAGVMVDSGGLLPSEAGARVRVNAGHVSVTDGPFAETKELVGGYAILRANSKEEAIAHGKRFMMLHAELLGPAYEGELEIRQMAEFPQEEGR